MPTLRQWFCSCTGKKRELVMDPHVEEDSLEPTCPRCGATPSSDPRRTISYRELDEPAD